MPRPLQPVDPPRVGPFRLTGRLHESPAGIVYLGEDPYGVHVSVALLTKGAAGDAAARDRFRAAITEEMPLSTGVPYRPPLWTAGEKAPLVAAQPEGTTPWVATVHDSVRPGAERFLEPVMIGSAHDPRGERADAGETADGRADAAAGEEAGEKDGEGGASPGGGRGAAGPRFEPYWAGARDPAVLAPASPRRFGDRGLVAALITLALLLLILALALAMLMSCEPRRVPPPPTPSPSPSSPTPRPSPTPTPSPEPSPTPTTPSPSPTSGTVTPDPSGTGSGGPV